MAIYRDLGRMSIECDECGDVDDEDFEQDEFRAMIDHAKSIGWAIVQIDSDYRHICPLCLDKATGAV